jgi:predicted DNA-binding protein with PD1-like motif
MKVAALLLVAAISFGADAQPSGYYKKISENTYVLALKPGAKLVASLRAFQRATGTLSASVTGFGALKNARLGQYRYAGEPFRDGRVATEPTPPIHEDVTVKGHREIVSVMCNLTTNLVTAKGLKKTDPHCHVALAGSDKPAKDSQNGYPVVGGHLVEGEIDVLGEFFITTYPAAVNKQEGGGPGGSVIKLDETEGGTPLNAD